MKVDIFNMTIDLKPILYSIVYIIIGIVIYNVIRGIIVRVLKKGKSTKYHNQRVETLVTLLLNIIIYIIVIIVTISILGTFGVNVTSIVAGLGITTAIIGLAFQDLAKDLIAGFSIITEGQYEVGDTIEVDGFIGQVVFLGLKTTRIRNYKGQTKIIANHYLDKLVNYSLNNSLAIVDVGVAYEEDADKVEKVLNELASKLNGTIEHTTGDIQVLGIIELADSSLVYRVTVETESMQHYAVERYLRKEIKRAFEESKVKIPYPQIEVHNGK